ncbi:hypothetical protein [Microbacterium hydrocarbonoxydans]|uniref:hypothetical protein n=1 Tax=Microbacterium hydrocarbonoxydans TaxID=273678 RepID=UPI003D969E8A
MTDNIAELPTIRNISITPNREGSFEVGGFDKPEQGDAFLEALFAAARDRASRLR